MLYEILNRQFKQKAQSHLDCIRPIKFRGNSIVLAPSQKKPQANIILPPAVAWYILKVKGQIFS